MQPYDKSLIKAAGIYMVRCGESYYIGGASYLGWRRVNHRSALRSGKHYNKALQQAYDASGEFEFLVIEVLDSNNLKEREQIHLNRHFGATGCCNASACAKGNSSGDALRKLWKTEEFRKAHLERSRAQLQLQKGENHPLSRQCVFSLDGKTISFPCALDAAKHFGVSHQVIGNWLWGRSPWPGSTRRKVRRGFERLKGLTGKFA